MNNLNTHNSSISAGSSWQEMRQNTTLAVNEKIIKSPFSNLDDLTGNSFIKKPATISDPTNVVKEKNYVKSKGLIVLNDNINSKKNSLNLNDNPLINIFPKDDDNNLSKKLNLIVDKTSKLKDSILDFASINTARTIKNKYLNKNNVNDGVNDDNDADDDNDNKENEKHFFFDKKSIPHAHFRTLPRTSSPTSNLRHYQSNYYTPTTQNILADAISPSVVGTTNIRFVTTSEREIRDKQVTQALGMISQSMEPPEHNIDKLKNWILNHFHDDNKNKTNQPIYYKLIDFLLDWPLWIFRQFWNYVILEIHLGYNLILLYVSFFITPSILFFVIGFTLFWIKIIYELYRDIMHRDDPVYQSLIPREMSFAAALSASFGFVMKVKAESGDITDAWWRNE